MCICTNCLLTFANACSVSQHILQLLPGDFWETACRQQDTQEQYASAKEELEYYGKIWLGCAAAAVAAFALLSGQYVSIATDEDDFDDDL